MNKILCALAIPLISMPALARPADRAEAGARFRSAIEFLADPALKGRKAGTEENRTARQWIARRFEALGLKTFEGADGYYQRFRAAGGDHANVIGHVGEDPARAGATCLLIGAHYDGKGIEDGEVLRSADDNASGVAMLLELARHFVSRESSACVAFAAWDFEEGSPRTLGGVKGSKHFVDEPLFPLDRISVYVNFDLVGGAFFRGGEDLVFALGMESSPALGSREDEVRPEGFELMRFDIDAIEPLGPLVPRSDYGRFRDAEIPYVFFTTGTPSYYHTAADTPDVIRYGKMAALGEYLKTYLAPIAEGRLEVPRERGAKIRWRQLQHSIDLLRRLLAAAEENALAEEDVERLRADLERMVAASESEGWGDEVKDCWFQAAFIGVLDALGVLRGGVNGYVGRIIRASCLN